MKKVKNIAGEHLHLERVMMLRKLEKKALENQRIPKPDPKLLATEPQPAAANLELAVSTQSVRDKLNVMASKNLSPLFDPSLAPEDFPKLTEFNPFKRLAPEMRLKVWDIILREIDPRVVEVIWDAKNEEYYASCGLPVLLHVNRESRAETLRQFSLFMVENPIKAEPATENANNRARGNAFVGRGGYVDYIEAAAATTFEIASQGAKITTVASQSDNGEVTKVVPKYSTRPFGAYINFENDLLYLSLGSFTRDGRKLTDKMIDFLSKIDAGTVNKLQKIAFEPLLYPFNNVLQKIAGFPNLQVCAGVKSDVCLSYINRGHVNAAPHLPAIGFGATLPDNIGFSERWSVQEGRIESRSTAITWEEFKERLARMKAKALELGIDGEWINQVQFVVMDIKREQESKLAQDI